MDTQVLTKSISNHPLQDRQRVRRACDLCRKKKIKCNGEEPCYRCASYGTICVYPETGASVRLVGPDNVERLERRVTSMGNEFESRVVSMERLLQKILDQLNCNKSVVHRVSEKDATQVEIQTARTSETNEQAISSVLSSTHRNPLEAAPYYRVENEQVGNINDEYLAEQADQCASVEEPELSHRCYSDEFGELVTDVNGLFRYVGLGSTAYIVDRCAGLRRHINTGLKRKGYETGETFLTSQVTPDHEETASFIVQTTPQYALPPRKLVQVLFRVYSEELFPIFPIISEAALWAIYDRFVSSSSIDHGFAAIFFSALAAAAPLVPQGHATFEGLDGKYSEKSLGPYFYKLASHYSNYPATREKGSQPKDNIIAFGLLSMYLAETGSQAEAWVMNGRAIRLGQDIGLHRSPARLHLPLREQSERRYIWWCLYVLERQLCTALGRPLAIDNTDCDVEFPEEPSAFVTLIQLYKILGFIIKTVNSVKNASGWRESAKHEEIRAKIRELNSSLQTWAKERVPQAVKRATHGRLLSEKHIFLSSYYSAVIALYRVFMPHPHRQSAPESTQAQVRCAKVATDCIRGSFDFLKNVNKGHYRVLHGQNIFVCAIILLQCIRTSEDPNYVSNTVLDVQLALQTLTSLEDSWEGAKKCRGIVEEYLEFTVLVQRGYYKKCSCENRSTDRTSLRSHNPKKRMEGPQTTQDFSHGSFRHAKKSKHTQPDTSHQTYDPLAFNRVVSHEDCQVKKRGVEKTMQCSGVSSQSLGGWNRSDQIANVASNIEPTRISEENETLLDDFFGDFLHGTRQGSSLENDSGLGELFTAADFSAFDTQLWALEDTGFE